MTPITISKCSNGGYFVSQGDKVSDRLGPDEALGVVAHALFGDGSAHRFLDTVAGWQEREVKHRERMATAIEPDATPPPAKGNVVGYEGRVEIPIAALDDFIISTPVLDVINRNKEAQASTFDQFDDDIPF